DQTSAGGEDLLDAVRCQVVGDVDVQVGTAPALAELALLEPDLRQLPFRGDEAVTAPLRLAVTGEGRPEGTDRVGVGGVDPDRHRGGDLREGLGAGIGGDPADLAGQLQVAGAEAADVVADQPQPDPV